MLPTQHQGSTSELQNPIKKKKLTGFLLFVIERRKASTDRKIRSMGLQLAVNLFQQEWQQLSEEQKEEWKSKVKTENEQPSTSSASAAGGAFNFTEVSDELVDIGRKAAAQELFLYNTLLKEGSDIKTRYFAVVHFNIYSRTTEGVLPAEFCFGIFSVMGGMKWCRNSMLYPKMKGSSMSSLVRESVKKLGLPIPSNETQVGELGEINDDRMLIALKKIRNAGRKWDLHKTPETPAVVFARREDIEIIKECVKWLNTQHGMNLEIHVFSVSMLLVMLSEIGVKDRTNVIPVESEAYAENYIFSDTTFDCDPELGCEWHRQEKYLEYGEVTYCSENIVRRTIYKVLIALTRIYGNKVSVKGQFSDKQKDRAPEKEELSRPVFGVRRKY